MRYVSIPVLIKAAVRAGWSWSKIANALNAAGGRTSSGDLFTDDTVMVMAIELIFPDVIALPDPVP